MVAKVGSLQLQVSANVARISRDLGKIERRTKSSMARVKGIARTAMRAITGLIAAEAMRRLLRWQGALIDSADNMGKLAKKTGVATETLSSFAYASKLGGTNMEIVSKGLKMLAKNMEAASRNTGEAKDVFKALNIEMKRSDGTFRSTEAVLGDMADAFAQMEDGAKKSAYAQLTLGRAGQEMIPFMNEGRKGFRKMREEAERANVVISAKTAAAAEQFNDNMTRLSASVQGFGNAIMTSYLPGITALSDSFIEGAKAGGVLDGVMSMLVDTMDVWAGKYVPKLATEQEGLALQIVTATKALAAQQKLYDELAPKYKLTPEFLGVGTMRPQERVIIARFHTVNMEIGRLEGLIARYGDRIRELNKVRAKITEPPKAAPIAQPARTGLIDIIGGGGGTRFGEGILNRMLGQQMGAIRSRMEEWKTSVKDGIEHTDYLLAEQAEKEKRRNAALVADYQRREMQKLNAIQSWANQAIESIVRFTDTGKLSFSRMTDSILADMVRISAQRVFTPALHQLFGGLVGGMTGATSAHPGSPASQGAAAAGADVKSAADIMSMATSTMRGARGGTRVQVIDQRGAGEPVSVETEETPDGDVIRVLIRDTVNAGLASGEHDRAMRSAYGVSRVGGRR